MSTSAGGFGASEVISIVGISSRQLYYWESLGAVDPEQSQYGNRFFRRYSDRDVAVLKEIKQLVDEGYVVSKAVTKITPSAGNRAAGNRAAGKGAAVDSSGAAANGEIE